MRRLHRNPDLGGPDLLPAAGVLAVALTMLLRSFTTEAGAVQPSSDLEIPVAIDAEQAPLVASVVVSQRAILVDGVPIVDLERAGDTVAIPGSAKDGPVVRELLDVLSRKSLARGDASGRVTLLADPEVPYSVLREVMYTSALARFGDFRFVAIEGG